MRASRGVALTVASWMCCICLAASGTALVFGHKAVQVCAFNTSTDTPSIVPVGRPLEVKDWVWDAKLVRAATATRGALLALGLGHNRVELWQLPCPGDAGGDFELVATMESSVRCLLYCFSFCDCHAECQAVASGTVFNKVLLWDTTGLDTAARGSDAVVAPSVVLEGHTGVLFRITWSADGRSLLTVSDDRSVRLWSCAGEAELASPDYPATCVDRVADATALPHHASASASTVASMPYHEVWAGYGHAARLWGAQFSRRCIVSSSEDTAVCLWSYSGECLATLDVRLSLSTRSSFMCACPHPVCWCWCWQGHAGKHCWRLAVSPHGVLASGGGDSSIKLWNIDTTLDQAHGGALAARHMVPLPTTPATPAPEAVAVLDAPSPSDDGATPAPAGGNKSKKKKKKKQKRGGKADAVVRVALTSRGDRVVVTSRLVRACSWGVAVHPCTLLTCLARTCLHRRASCLPWT